MKIAGYICDHCRDSHDFPEEDIRDEYLCPKCGRKMWYLMSSEIDDETGLSIKNWYDKDRGAQASGMRYKQPTITCPYCKSTDTEKISAWDRLGGVFASGKVSNNWHCNRCDSDF